MTALTAACQHAQESLGSAAIRTLLSVLTVMAREPGFFPSLNDIEAQRMWLGGFGASWVSDTDDGESVDEALVRVMEGKKDLLRQLRSYRAGWASREVH